MDISGIRKELYMISLFDEQYITHKANEYLNLKEYDIMLGELLTEKELEDDVKVKETLQKINGNKKLRKELTKKFRKKISKQSFVINFLKDVQRSLIERENIARALLTIREVQMPTIMKYYCKSSFERNYHYSRQEHIPFLFTSDSEFVKFSIEHKIWYLVNKRDKDIIIDNTEFFYNNYLSKMNGDNDYDDIVGKMEKNTDLVDELKDNCEKFENDEETVDSDMFKIFKRRFVNMTKRCESNNYPTPKIELYREVFEESLNSGFKCYYCGQHMRIKGDAQQKGGINFEDMFTFEHRRPLSKGGVHSKENLKISCMSCNTIKSDMDEDLFINLIKEISSDTKYRLYQEAMYKDTLLKSKFHTSDKVIKEKEDEITHLKKKVKTLEVEKKQLMDKF